MRFFRQAPGPASLLLRPSIWLTYAFSQMEGTACTQWLPGSSLLIFSFCFPLLFFLFFLPGTALSAALVPAASVGRFSSPCLCRREVFRPTPSRLSELPDHITSRFASTAPRYYQVSFYFLT